MKRIHKLLTLFILPGIMCVQAIAAQKFEDIPGATVIQNNLARSVPLEKIDSDKGLEKLTGFPAGAGNAGENYARLEALYQQDKDPDDQFKIKPGSQGLREIFQAVTKKMCRLSPDFYPAMTSGESKQPDLVVYLAYQSSLFELAKSLEEKGDYKGADAVLRCALIFGWHLTQQPPSLLVQMLGIRMKYLATIRYSAFLQRKLDIKRSDDALRYSQYLEKVQKVMGGKLNIYLGNMLGFNSLYSAIRIAKEDQDPVWRQEAVLRLGVYRHGVPSSEGKIIATDEKYQKAAEETLTWIAANGSPQNLRPLAIWATKQLTPQSFVDLRKNVTKVGDKK